MSLTSFLKVLGAVAVLTPFATARDPVWIAAIQPFTGGNWDAGLSIRMGAEVILEQINAHRTLLPDHEIKIIWQDGDCNLDGVQVFFQNVLFQDYQVFAPGKTFYQLDTNGDGEVTTQESLPFQAVWNATEVSPAPVALLGPCAGATKQIVPVAASARFPIVGNIASAPDLSDRIKYPNYYRTIVPDTANNAAWLALVQALGLRRLAAVVGETVRWGLQGRLLAEGARTRGLELLGDDLSSEIPGFVGMQVNVDSPSVAAEASRTLVRLRVRFVALFMMEKRCRMVLCELHKQKYFNGIYASFGWFTGGWWNMDDTACGSAHVKAMVVGMILGNMQYFRTDDKVRMSCSENMTVSEFRQEVVKRHNVGSHHLEVVGEYGTTADAVCMLALMLHRVLVAEGVSLADMATRTRKAYNKTQIALAATDFEGAQGRVSFKPGDADVQGTMLLQQLRQDDTLLDVALYMPPSLSFIGNGSIIFGLPNEIFEAVPGAGALKIENGRLADFAVCPDTQMLNMRTNLCVDCPNGTMMLQEFGTCVCIPGFSGARGLCTPCPAGNYSASAGQPVCTPCDPGLFTSELGSTACKRCPLGTYKSVNHTNCMGCPAGMTTPFLGATAMEDCTCDNGFFLAKGGTITGPCLSCPPGLKCLAGSKYDNFALAASDPTKIAPELPVFFWSDPAEPTSVFACRIDMPRCPGGLPGQCHGGLIGRVCAICPDGQNLVDGGCKDCQAGVSAAVYLMIIALIVVSVFSYYFGNGNQTTDLTVMIAASTLLSQFLTILQILSMYGNLNVEWPVHIADLFKGLGFTMGSGSIPYDCFIGSAAELRYGARLSLPILFVVIVFLLYLSSKLFAIVQASLVWEKDRTLNTAGQLLQAVFISIAASVVVPFECYSHPNGLKSITQFPEVLCNKGGGHSVMLASGIVLGLIFVVPFLGWCIWGPFTVVRVTSTEMSLRRLHRFRFLLFRFRPDVWWWGTVLLFRQLLLAFAPSMPSDKPHIQSIYTVVVLTGYGLLQAHFWPWKAPELNLLDVTISMNLIAVVVIATSFLPASTDGHTYETLLFVVLCLIGLVVSIVSFRIVKYLCQRKETFGPDSKQLSEKQAVEAFQRIEQIVKQGQNEFVANVQLMSHYDCKAMLKGIDVYAVVGMNAAPSTKRLVGLMSTKSSRKSPKSGMGDNTKQGGEIKNDLSVEVGPPQGGDIKDDLIEVGPPSSHVV